MNLGLEGKVALITGGGSDVGRAIAAALAHNGAAVAVNYLSSEAAATRGRAQRGPHRQPRRREKILASYPIRRAPLGRPADVAPLVAFLASEHAAWITGQTISVSGGYATAG